MAKNQDSQAFNPNDTTTFIRNALEKERKFKAGFSNDLKQVARLHGRARACLAHIFRADQARRPLDLEELKVVVADMQRSLEQGPNPLMLGTTLQFPEEHDACHSFNTTVIAMRFGQQRKLRPSEVASLGLGCMLHDLGKSRIPPLMLVKPDKLDETELAAMHRHATDGHAALQASGQVNSAVLDIVRCHHERSDGRGYPMGLEGDSVPELARIAALADAYDSLTGGYGYRRPVSPVDALHVLNTEALEEYGEELVQGFIRCIGIYPVGTLLQLNSGAYVMVVGNNPNARLKPLVLQIRDEDGKLVKQRPLYDLSSYSEQESAGQWGVSEVADPRTLGLDLPGIVFEEIMY